MDKLIYFSSQAEGRGFESRLPLKEPCHSKALLFGRSIQFSHFGMPYFRYIAWKKQYE